ncbi:MAG TPA: hypothetical protein VHA79_13630 [Mycobacteriales bacterium]|jgi:hypothetical protein|nr:hypothetical protein [Mycobacteriales bacterium]
MFDDGVLAVEHLERVAVGVRVGERRRDFDFDFDFDLERLRIGRVPRPAAVLARVPRWS